MPKYSYIFIITSILLYDMFPSIGYLGNTLSNQRYHVKHIWPSPPVVSKSIKSAANKDIFFKIIGGVITGRVQLM